MRYLGFFCKVQECDGIKINSFLQEIKKKCCEADRIEEYGVKDGCLEINCSFRNNCNKIVSESGKNLGPAFWKIAELEKLRKISGVEIQKQTAFQSI